MLGIKWTLIFVLSLNLFIHGEHIHSHPRPYHPEKYPGDGDRPLVVLEDGVLKGFTMRTVYEREVAAFRTIPYAEPPVGPLRFQDPHKNKPWEGIRDAQIESPQCIQADLVKNLKVHGQEDCLYLNVYVSLSHLQSCNIEPPLPVMVWFEGGAFFWGAGSISGPAYLLDQDVILVTINHRLGPFGYFSTGDAACPGNQGMKDQVMALQWVQKNMDAFGGDPTSVTIFGVSSGSTSVGLHLVSPLSQGLFQRAILESGTAFNFWAVRPDPEWSARQVGEKFNCPVESSQEMVECLRFVSAEQLAPIQLALATWNIYPLLVFVPSIEPNLPGAFLTKPVEQYYADGEAAKVPVIAGFTAYECTFIVSAIIGDSAAVHDINADWDRVVPTILQLNYGPTELQTARAEALREFYMGDLEFNWDSRFEFSQIISARHITVDSLRWMRVHSMYTRMPLYVYRFSYEGRFSMVELFGQKPEDWRVGHMDDPIYILNNTDYYGTIEKNNTKDLEMSGIMTRTWARFAKYGDPNGKPTGHGMGVGKTRTWLPIEQATNTFSKLRFYDLNLHSKMIADPYEDEYRFWREFIDT